MTQKTTNGAGWHGRLRDAFEKTGWKKTELARRAGVPYDSVNKYLRGEIEKPRGDTLDKLAKALDMEPLFLREGLVPGPVISESRVPHRGEVAAGAWLEVDPISEEPKEWLPFNPLPQFPATAVYTLTVKGDSLDKVAQDGADLVCVDLGITGLSVKDGDLVIVERHRFQDGLVEVTAKRIRRVDGELMLIPESNNPRWQTAYFRLSDAADDTSIRVVARVDYILNRP